VFEECLKEKERRGKGREERERERERESVRAWRQRGKDR